MKFLMLILSLFILITAVMTEKKSLSTISLKESENQLPVNLIPVNPVPVDLASEIHVTGEVGDLCTSEDDCNDKQALCVLNGPSFICQMGCNTGDLCKSTKNDNGEGNSNFGKCHALVKHSQLICLPSIEMQK